MEENNLILHLGTEGGGAEVYETQDGKYIFQNQIYSSLPNIIDKLKGDLCYVYPLHIAPQYIDKVAEALNSELEKDEEIGEYNKRDWEVWLNRRYSKYSKKFYAVEEPQYFRLTNPFGSSHRNLHVLLEKLLKKVFSIYEVIENIRPTGADEANTIYQQHGLIHQIVFEYYVKLRGWCVDENNERFTPFFFGSNEVYYEDPNKEGYYSKIDDFKIPPHLYRSYDFPSSKYEENIWREMFRPFNITIQMTCIYKYLIEQNYSLQDALRISELGCKEHLELGELLFSEYTYIDEDEECRVGKGESHP